MTTKEVAARFEQLAAQEQWFQIQDELFADDVKSIDPNGSPYFGYTEGKASVKKKGEDFVGKVTAGHARSTTKPIVAANHFVVGRYVDITTQDHGRIVIDELMLYEVRDGKIVSEQFFY